METPTTGQNQWTTTKFYWYGLLLLALLLAALAFIAYRSLDMGDDLNERIVSFASFNKKLFYANLFGFLTLLAIAAYIHRKQGKWLYYLPPCALFVVFVHIGYMVLNVKLFSLQESYDLTTSGVSVNRIFSIALSSAGVLMTALVFVGISITKRNR